MPKLSRRDCLQGMAATVAAAGGMQISASIREGHLSKQTDSKGPGIKLALILGAQQTHRIRLARQMGVRHAIIGVGEALSKVPHNRYVETLESIKAAFAAEDMVVAGVEGHPVPAEKIKLGLPGRDEEIDHYRAALEALGKVGIAMVCSNFTAGLHWYRTKLNLRGRGGALVTGFDAQEAEKQGLTQWGRISRSQMWENMEYYLKGVIPAAEKAGVQMAMHPPDPPVPSLRGIARIPISASDYRRMMQIVPSPVNGVTFDHSIFYLMGEDIKTLAHEWCEEKKIFFIHSRNVHGTRDHFVETFHDDGDINFREMYRTYYDSGFRGPVRPDHAPTMDGEPNDHPGYEILGKIFAIGYIKGILKAQKIPYV